MRKDSLSLNHFRLRLSELEALPQWVLLGLLSGLLTTGVILAFRAGLLLPMAAALPDGNPEHFEALPAWLRFGLPVGGSVLVGLILWRWPANGGVGITHVLERLSYHQGRMPLSNLLSQFIAAALLLGSGHSGGREGPAVHLGAGASSVLGQRLRLPNNSLRTLVGCGTAAAIAASFNTPIAGIIFAMEVVMMEYTVAGFIPVMVAAVTASLLTQLVLGDLTHFAVPPLDIHSLNEVPFILLLGLLMGLLAVSFSRIALLAARLSDLSIQLRLLLAGLLVGTVGLAVPAVMGIGYDSLSQILAEGGALEFLLLLTVAKLVVTAITVGLGTPVGLIGPTLLIGAAAGSAIGIIGIDATDQQVAELPLYAMLGMGAMMGATLQAPLAALLALLELTLNPNIIFPGMLAIITATLVYRMASPEGSIFHALLRHRGLDWRRAPLDDFLDKNSVISLMRQHLSAPNRTLPLSEARLLNEHLGDWILVLADGQPKAAVARTDLALYLEQQQELEAGAALTLDLLEFPARRRDLRCIDIQATLKEALRAMNDGNVDALCVLGLDSTPQGLLFRDDIERQFRLTRSHSAT